MCSGQTTEKQKKKTHIHKSKASRNGRSSITEQSNKQKNARNQTFKQNCAIYSKYTSTPTTKKRRRSCTLYFVCLKPFLARNCKCDMYSPPCIAIFPLRQGVFSLALCSRGCTAFAESDGTSKADTEEEVTLAVSRRWNALNSSKRLKTKSTGI